MVKPTDFGLMLAINGVLLGGGDRVMPFAKAAFAKLIDGRGNFRVPTVFVTNMTKFGRQAVAHKLMIAFGVRIDPDQVVMGHSPLRLFRQFHNQHIFVCGSGNTREIMHQLGFNKVSNADQLRETFRSIYKSDEENAFLADYGTAPSTSYGALQSIVLLNEPERWEINLQLILDLLFSDGFRRKRVELKASNKPHLPIIACGIDLLKTGFSNESSDDQFVTQEGGPPRIGHGAFLIALEQMFEKLSGRSLNYAALVGKPSPITYVFAEQVLREQARRNNASLRRIYAIGDNPHADVYGANLFNRLLALRRREREPQSETQPLDSEDQHLLSHVMEHSGMNLASMFDEEQSIKGSVLESESSAFASPSFVTASSSVHRARRGNEIEAFRLQFSGVATSRHAVGAASVRERERDSDPAGFSAPPLPPQPPQTSRSALEACVSVLVQTGITSEMGAATTSRFAAKDHFHRDLPRFRDCSTPAHVCANIDEALRTVFTAEQYEPSSSL